MGGCGLVMAVFEVGCEGQRGIIKRPREAGVWGEAWLFLCNLVSRRGLGEGEGKGVVCWGLGVFW